MIGLARVGNWKNIKLRAGGANKRETAEHGNKPGQENNCKALFVIQTE